MRRILVCASLLLSGLWGCSAQVDGRADTSGETAPKAVDLSPTAEGGKTDGGGGTPPNADAISGGAAEAPPAAKPGAEEKK